MHDFSLFLGNKSWYLECPQINNFDQYKGKYYIPFQNRTSKIPFGSGQLNIVPTASNLYMRTCVNGSLAHSPLLIVLGNFHWRQVWQHLCESLQHTLKWSSVYFIYLFIYLWLHWVVAVGPQLSLVVAFGGFSLPWFLLLQSMGSRAWGLCCFMSYGIFLDQGSNPCPLHWQVNS